MESEALQEMKTVSTCSLSVAGAGPGDTAELLGPALSRNREGCAREPSSLWWRPPHQGCLPHLIQGRLTCTPAWLLGKPAFSLGF